MQKLGCCSIPDGLQELIVAIFAYSCTRHLSALILDVSQVAEHAFSDGIPELDQLGIIYILFCFRHLSK